MCYATCSVAASITKLTVVKRFTYRGDSTEEWSNGYVMKGVPPTTSAQWDSLRTTIVALELPILSDQTFVVRVIGHTSTDPGAIAAYEYDYTVPGPPPQGTFSGVAGVRMAGDQAAVIEWLTDRKTSKGKPIYLRKYFHGAFTAPSNPDNLETAWETAAATYAAGFTATLPWGGLTNNAGTATVQSSKILPFSTTRTLEKRGKRKKVA